MKNTKNKKNEKLVNKDKGDKEGTLTKILILVIFVILVFYVPDLWKEDLIQRGFWELKAKDNIEANFTAMEGDNYIFVEGSLRTKCDRLESQNHCPRAVWGKSETPVYLANKFLYLADIQIFRSRNMDARFNITNMDFMLFLEKEKEKSFTLNINDYVLASLCRQKLFNDTVCSISWNKKFPITNLREKRKGVWVNVTRFDIAQANNTIKAEVGGTISGNLTAPVLELRVYSRSNQTLILDTQQNISLAWENNHYVFHTYIIFPTKEFLTSNEGYLLPEEEKNMNYTLNRVPQSVLLLLRDQDYFYAKEKAILDNNEPEEKTFT